MAEAFTNFLAGSPLNRLSWLRTSHSFLNAVVVSPATRWILFSGGQPLIASHPGTTQKRSLALLTTEDVKPLLGAEPFFGQGEQEGEHCTSDIPVLEAARVRGPSIVFLGLKETETSGSALPSSEFKDPHSAVAKLTGTPYFSADVADLDENKVNEAIENTGLAKDGSTLAFMEPRAAMSSLDAYTAAIFAEARSMVDWNQRNKFCPACGSPVYSLWAGWKLSCTSLLPWADNTDRKPCPSGRGLHNFAHPRTDPVVIMLAIDESGEKVLLGRNKKFPGKFYSALAGFIEPGESFEDAVKREMWEEAGVKVWNVRYHSGQPWPYPANLMVGYYATADSSAPIRTDLDNELEDARWYTREEILAVLRHASGTHFSRRDHQKLGEIQDGPDNNPMSQDQSVEVNNNDEPPFRIPAPTAIAGVLIQHWAEGKAKVLLESGSTAKACM
ncbi:NUDIX hydrolase domain-like protein [Suillus subaureus]|uniref:NAD(+) diphosphatase n=1 Tax=Suillus subaureus TaxID=48587 RepID=A0A9P7J6Z0_9AGAM|nr:NUDIX hydrolase domain-like protein [Suillus subaureus]KAG1806096.1 NUDIX hydrolase domain-like protein [Suillus subaureus]